MTRRLEGESFPLRLFLAHPHPLFDQKHISVSDGTPKVFDLQASCSSLTPNWTRQRAARLPCEEGIVEFRRCT